MKKILALVMAVAMLLGCVAFAEEAAPALQNDLYILFTSDVHCGIEDGWGYVGLDMIRDNLVAQGKHVILVDNGDSIQGSPLGTMTKGSANVDLMNAMGYEVAIPGNHEFDYGMDNFLALTEKANFPYISANFNKEGELVFAPYVIKEYDGVKVAFVGMTTPKTLISSTPKYFMDDAGNFVYGFFQSDDGQLLYSKVQEAVDAARAEGAAYVVAMGHMGNEAGCMPYTYADVIANTNGIDLFLDGHSHDTDHVEMLNKDGDNVIRQACGTKMEGVGYAVIGADGKLSAGIHLWNDKQSFVKLTGATSDVAEAITAATAELDAALKTVVAHTAYDLVITDPANVDENGKEVRIVRNSETNLGELCADAYRYVSGADIAFVNGGGVRAKIPAGDITREQILNVHPYGNSLCVVKATGQEILDALEYGAKDWPSEFGGWLHVSGLTFELHTYLPSTATQDTNGLFSGVTGEYRVKNVMVNGEPLDLEKEYTLSCHNYKLKNMGDGYSMFADNELLQDEVMLDNQVLMTYLTEGMNGEVDAQYEDIYGQGRITFVTEAPAAQ